MAVSLLLAAFLTKPAFSQIRQARHVQILAMDGVRLQATLYEAKEQGPGVLLHHMCGDWRADYHALARRLKHAGYTVLIYDLRGQGQSEGSIPFANRAVTPEELDAFFAEDARIALDYLRKQPTVDSEQIVVGGASCGTIPAVRLALEHENVRGVILLSGLPETLETLLETRTGLPLFGVTAKNDPSGQLEEYEALRARSDEASRVHIFETGGHGTYNLTAHPELHTHIIGWLRDILKHP